MGCESCGSVLIISCRQSRFLKFKGTLIGAYCPPEARSFRSPAYLYVLLLLFLGKQVT
jgi:hypothetical protein